MYAVQLKIKNRPKEIHPIAVFWVLDIGADRLGQHIRVAGKTKRGRPVDFWMRSGDAHDLKAAPVTEADGRYIWPKEEYAQWWVEVITKLWCRHQQRMVKNRRRQ